MRNERSVREREDSVARYEGGLQAHIGRFMFGNSHILLMTVIQNINKTQSTAMSEEEWRVKGYRKQKFPDVRRRRNS
jgi:hypothetical protein